MALDRTRNRAYFEALRRVVTPDSVVLDLGAGTGVLGLMAARLGARRVYLVDPEDIIDVAAEITEANGLARVVECVRARIEDVRLDEPPDIIVSVLTGNFLVTEDLLETLFFARDHLLKPGGTLVPSEAAMEAVPVSAPELHDQDIAGWSSVEHGVDLSAARRYAANTVYYRSTEVRQARWLAEPRELYRLDFARDHYGGVHARITTEIHTSGTCHGWAGWFRMRLGGEWLSTSPRGAAMHWTPAFLPADPPVPVEEGERVTFALDRMPFGDWNWRMESRAGCREHTTLLGAPLSVDLIRRAALDYAPALTDDGRVLLQVLTACDGHTTVDALATQLLAAHATQFASVEEARRAILRIVRRYA